MGRTDKHHDEETEDLTKDQFLSHMKMFQRERPGLSCIRLFKLFVLLAAKEASHEKDLDEKLAKLINSGEFKAAKPKKHQRGGLRMITGKKNKVKHARGGVQMMRS